MTEFVLMMSVVWVVIAIAFLLCFNRITNILNDKLSRHVDQIDSIFHNQKLDRAEHRRSLQLIRDDLVVISGSVQEVRRIARTCEHKFTR